MAQGLNVELKYGSERHSRILSAVMARYELSEKHMNKFSEKFEAAENQHLAYVPTTEVDQLRKDAREEGVKTLTTLHIPYSYSIVLAAHTYWTSVFLGRNPVLQYQARHGEPEMQVQMLEALIDYQVQVGRMMGPFYIWLHDVARYGVGVVWNYWDTEEMWSSQIVLEPKTYLGIPIPGTERKVKKTVRVKGYEGNKLFNVRPQDFFPDPRVPLSNVQAGEFVCRKVDSGWTALLTGQDQGRYFNLDAVKKQMKDKASQSDRETGTQHQEYPSNVEQTATLGTLDIEDVGFSTLTEVYIKLVPKDWGFGSSSSPEMWVFTVANEKVIIEARPCGYLHGRFPCFTLCYEMDGYTNEPRGMYDVLTPLNETMNWLVNTHFFNVRSALNNMFVVDPRRIVMRDVTDPGEGKVIRLKEDAYGTDVRAAIMQLPVADVTSGHLRDTQVIADMMQRASGVTDNIMGMQGAGGRKTATEIRTSSSFGINRLKTLAEFWSAGDWSLMAQVFVQNTQQFYDAEKKFKIAGDLLDYAKDPFIMITPDDIKGFFDFVPVDGTMPVDRFAQANLWREILGGLRNMPEIAQQYDTGGIFAWMAQLAGLKNIKQFKVQVSPDAMLAQQAQAGNMVPVGGPNGGPPRNSGGGASSRGPGGVGTRVPEASQISGMGPTG